MTSAEDLAQTAVEALLDDETLRGDLTDTGFSPVVRWATDVALAQTAAWLAQPDPRAAMWESIGALKGLVRGVVGAAEALAPEPLLDAAGPLADAALEALDAVDWSEDVDANAQAIVAAIASLPWADALVGNHPAPQDRTLPACNTGDA